MALILKNLKFVCQVFNFEELNKVINLKILFDNLSIKHKRFRTRYDKMYHQVSLVDWDLLCEECGRELSSPKSNLKCIKLTKTKFTSRPGTLLKFLSLLTIHIHQNFLHGKFPKYIKPIIKIPSY